MQLARVPESLGVVPRSGFETPDRCATSQCIGVERNCLAEAMVFARLFSHTFDYIGRLRQEFLPTPVRIDLREQHSADCFLLFFRKFLRSGIGFVKKVCHGGHSNPSRWPEPALRGASARS